MVKKSAGTLPIRKHKFAPTPNTGQAITKFFDKKEEQARLQQQLARPKPAQPPPVFLHHQAVSAAAPTASAEHTRDKPAAIAAAAAAPLQQSKAIHAAGAHLARCDHPQVQAADIPHEPARHNQPAVQQQPIQTKPMDNGGSAAIAITVVNAPRQMHLDNMLMSQDDDGCSIKWQASPRQQSATPAQAGPPASSVPSPDITAMKQRLANAVLKSAGNLAESAKQGHHSDTRDTLLDDLLALPPPQHSRLHKVTTLDSLETKVLSPSTRGNIPNAGTPGSALKTNTPGDPAGGHHEDPRRKVTFGTAPESAGSGTPSSVVTGSAIKKRAKKLQKVNQLSGTGGKRSAVRKRKAMVDLIDQLEMMVKSRNVKERLDGQQLEEEDSGLWQGALSPAGHLQKASTGDHEADMEQREDSVDQDEVMHDLAPEGPAFTDDPSHPELATNRSHASDKKGNVAARSDNLARGEQSTAVVADGGVQPDMPRDQNSCSQPADIVCHASTQLERNNIAGGLEGGSHTQADLHPDTSTAKTASTCGVLAQDFLDELDPETAEQLAEVERAAQQAQQAQQTRYAQHSQPTLFAQHTQHAQHSQQAQRAQQAQHGRNAQQFQRSQQSQYAQQVQHAQQAQHARQAQHTLQTQRAQQAQHAQHTQQATASNTQAGHPLHQRRSVSPPQGSKQAASTTVSPADSHELLSQIAHAPLYTSAAAPSNKQPVGSALNHSEPACASVASDSRHAMDPQHAQRSVFDLDDPFDDACDLDDDLAQLLDSAAALRPAGPPHTAEAGPSHTVLAALSHIAPAGHKAAAHSTHGFAASGQHPTSSNQSHKQILPQLAGDRANVHYKVKQVESSEFEKVLALEGTYVQEHVMVHLQDGWVDTPVEAGHFVNLVAEKFNGDDGSTHAVCNFESGMVILHPDMLLSGTRVSGSFRCKRQAVLEERFAGSSSDKAVEGTLLHEVFQAALTNRITSRARLEEVGRCVIAANTDKLFEVGLDEHMAMERLCKAISSMLSWVQRFLRPQPAQNAKVEAGIGQGPGGSSGFPMCVRQVMDIEENVWAPKYGLKGMIDASLSTVSDNKDGVLRHSSWMNNASHPQQPSGSTAADVVMPLEFKTGKPHISHRAQVSLYLLLMQERYGQVIESGLLWYLGSLSPQMVKLVPAELQALIKHRNALAGHLLSGQPLPEVIHDARACEKCFQKAACAISHKALEQGNEESSGLGPAYTELTGHISEASAQFWHHWLGLIELEEAPLLQKRAEIWTMPGRQREAAGRCIAGLRVDPASHSSPPSSRADQPLPGQIAKHKLHYTFAKTSEESKQNTDQSALNEMGFVEGDMVVLSIEGQQACVCRPTISGLTADSVTLAVDKPLRKYMLSSEVCWRIDKDEVSSIFTRMRCNLLDLMDPALLHVQQARRLIADLEMPAQLLQGHAGLPQATVSSLNSDQQMAVQRVTSTTDYTLILGMPGTGKTSTIVHTIKQLVAQGKSVLLTSYTNSAVDNVLLKLLQEGVKLLRLGRQESVHPLLQEWTVGGAHYPDTSVKALRLLSVTAQVVACTALGVNHCLLKGRVFDMCIVDEAGQMTLPVALGPILHSRAFTLVGDHHQLPPLVTSRAAEEGGLGISLFKRLCDAHPQTVVTLRSQYRMAADIMLLANTIVYDGQLHCGAASVADATLDLQLAPTQRSKPDWLTQVLAPSTRVLFLDTDSMPASEMRSGDALSNPGEAAVLTDMVGALLEGQLPLVDVGIISPYRAQVLLLQRICKDRSWSDLEVLTVDKCQGRDKDVVLLSLVRSNSECNAGNLLRDWRRLNVAITRAKKKLVLVGSQSTLRTIPQFAQLLQLMSDRQWVVQLPCTGQ